MLRDGGDLAQLVIEQPEVAVGLVERDAERVRRAAREAHRRDVVRNAADGVGEVVLLLDLEDVHPELDVAVGDRLAVRPAVVAVERDRDGAATVGVHGRLADALCEVDVRRFSVAKPIQRPPQVRGELEQVDVVGVRPAHEGEDVSGDGTWRQGEGDRSRGGR